MQKKCLVLRMQFTSNADGMPTLKRLFKVGVPSSLELNYKRRTKQLFAQTHTLTSAKNLKLLESLSLRVGFMAARSDLKKHSENRIWFGNERNRFKFLFPLSPNVD